MMIMKEDQWKRPYSKTNGCSASNAGDSKGSALEEKRKGATNFRQKCDHALRKNAKWENFKEREKKVGGKKTKEPQTKSPPE